MYWLYPVESHHGHTDEEPPGFSLSHSLRGLPHCSSGNYSHTVVGSDTMAQPLAKIWVPASEQTHFSYHQSHPSSFQLEASRQNASRIFGSHNLIGINSALAKHPNYHYVSDDEHVNYDPKEAVSSQYPWSRSSSIHLLRPPCEPPRDESTDQPDHRNLSRPTGYTPATSVSPLYHGTGSLNRDCTTQHYSSFEGKDTAASTAQDHSEAFRTDDNGLPVDIPTQGSSPDIFFPYTGPFVEPTPSSSLVWNYDQGASLEVYCHHEPVSASQYSSYSELTANILYLSEFEEKTKKIPGNFDSSESHNIIECETTKDAQQAITLLNTSNLASTQKHTFSSVLGQITQTSPTLTIQPTERRTQAKKSNEVKKMNLACLFCRERKIACGRPKDGSIDQTCNQCERRSFRCEYPTVSRRGQHKRPRKSGSSDIQPSGSEG